MANEVTPDVDETPTETVEEPEVDLSERLAQVRQRLVRIHQGAVSLRTRANAINDQAATDRDYLEKIDLDELDAIVLTLQGAGESLSALLTSK